MSDKARKNWSVIILRALLACNRTHLWCYACQSKNTHGAQECHSNGYLYNPDYFVRCDALVGLRSKD